MEKIIEQYKQQIMEIETTQRTKTFYYLPVGSWKRGVDYREQETVVLDEIHKLIDENVKVKSSSSRYFEFHITATNSSGTDLTDEIRKAIYVMDDVCKKHNLFMKTFSDCGV